MAHEQTASLLVSRGDAAGCPWPAHGQDAPHAAFGSGLAVPDAGLPHSAARARGDAKHVTQGQLSGQCGDGELLWHTQGGVLPSEPV